MGGSAMAAIIQLLAARQANPNLQSLGKYVNSKMGPPNLDKPFDAQFNTRLSPEEEVEFSRWKQTFAPNDSGVDYDLRGAFKAGLQPSPETGHWPDTFKKPNHPTFSDESAYAKYGLPGFWNGQVFIPPVAPVQPVVGGVRG